MLVAAARLAALAKYLDQCESPGERLSKVGRVLCMNAGLLWAPSRAGDELTSKVRLEEAKVKLWDTSFNANFASLSLLPRTSQCQ